MKNPRDIFNYDDLTHLVIETNRVLLDLDKAHLAWHKISISKRVLGCFCALCQDFK